MDLVEPSRLSNVRLNCDPCFFFVQNFMMATLAVVRVSGINGRLPTNVCNIKVTIPYTKHMPGLCYMQTHKQEKSNESCIWVIFSSNIDGNQ